MLYAEYRGEKTWASGFPNELAETNTCADGIEHYPRCPECGSRVTHHSKSIDGRAAHFAHCSPSGGGGGGGGSKCDGAKVGESQEHRAMKSIAASAVEYALSDVGVEESYLEEKVNAPHSDAECRKADCLIEFEQADEQLGEGLIIEVQYGNKNKNKNKVMFDYLSLEENYSVLWLWEHDFRTEASLPENWNCKLVHEQTVRDRVRRQIWPIEGEHAIWNKPRENVYHVSAAPVVVKNTHLYDSEKYISKTVRENKETEPPDPKLAGTALDGFVAEYRRSYDWDTLFRAKHAQEHIEEAIDQFSALRARENEIQFPVEAVAERYLLSNSWPSDFSREEKVNAVERWAERFSFSESDIRQWLMDTPERVQSVCPECFHPHNTDPIYDGEIKRGKTCRNCGEWFTVYDKRGAVSEVRP